MSEMALIPSGLSTDLFPVEQYPDLQFFRSFDPQRPFEKRAAVQVPDHSAVPEGMESLIVSQSPYAVFRYVWKGSVFFHFTLVGSPLAASPKDPIPSLSYGGIPSFLMRVKKSNIFSIFRRMKYTIMEIIQADLRHLDLLVPLFDGYRVFYQQPSDRLGATVFLRKRLTRKDSVIFLALEKKEGLGFIQMYPSFSSVSMQSVYILNDLYVDPSVRRHGIGKQLLLQAQEFALQTGLKGLELSTAKDNPAQFMYEKLGWKKDEDFLHYFWEVKRAELPS